MVALTVAGGGSQLAAAGVESTEVAEAKSSRTLRYQVLVAGQEAGEMTLHESQEGGLRVQESAMRLEFRRAGANQSLGMTSRFVESASGEPVEAISRQELGEIPVEVRYRFTAGKIHIESRQGEAAVHREVADPGGWLAPAAAQDLIEREMVRILAIGQGQFTVASIDPLLGPEKVTTQWTLELAAEPLSLGPHRVLASRWRQTQSFAPSIASIVHVSAGGDVLQSRTQLAGLDMVMVVRQDELAGLGLAELPAEESSTSTEAPPAATPTELGAAPEMLTRTFIRPDRPLPRPRTQRRVEYALRSSRPLDLPTVGYQHVAPHAKESDRNTVRVVVDLDLPVPAAPAEDQDLAPYLGASIYLNHENPQVRGLLVRALGARSSEGKPAARAEELRRFVHRYLERKDLRTILATASEVAAKASGDCTEHAVLLAALLRADGIPARVAFGLIYIDEFVGERQIFGYHLWTQAYLDGRWVDLDATLPHSFDAAHLTLGTSGLEDPMGALAQMTGALEAFSGTEISIAALPTAKEP